MYLKEGIQHINKMKLTKEEPSICKHCAYLANCKYLNTNIGEVVSEDYTCKDFEKLNNLSNE